MKVIKFGVLKVDRLYRQKCRDCDTVYEFSYKEGKLQTNPFGESYLVTTCPVCDNKMNTMSVDQWIKS